MPGWSETGALAALRWCAQTGVPAVVMSESTARDSERVLWKEQVKARIVQMCAGDLSFVLIREQRFNSTLGLDTDASQIVINTRESGSGQPRLVLYSQDNPLSYWSANVNAA